MWSQLLPAIGGTPGLTRTATMTVCHRPGPLTMRTITGLPCSGQIGIARAPLSRVLQRTILVNVDEEQVVEVGVLGGVLAERHDSVWNRSGRLRLRRRLAPLAW